MVSTIYCRKRTMTSIIALVVFHLIVIVSNNVSAAAQVDEIINANVNAKSEIETLQQTISQIT